MFANRFLPYGVNINTALGATGWINQIESTIINAGVSLFEETTGSEVDRQYVAEKELSPTVAIVTSDLTALTTIGYSGLFISPGSGTPGVTLFARQLPLGSLPTAIGTSAHISCTVSDGIIVPVSISCGNNDVAKLNFELHATLGTTATYSGATPLVYANSQAITSGSAATANVFTGGPAKFTVSGGSSFLVQGVSMSAVQFGITVNKEHTDSEVYASHVSIIARMSKMEFTIKDPTLAATIGDGVSVSAFAGYFRNVASAGQRVAPATTSHAKISGTAGMVTPGTLNLSHKRTGEMSFIYTPTFSTQQLTLSTAAAIPTS